MIINAVFSPVICLFLTEDGYLPSWLSWFQTPDNPAIGDDMFHRKEMSWTKSHYLYGIFWAIRNPAYGFADTCGFLVKGPATTSSVGTEGIDIGRDESTGLATATFGSVYRTLRNGDGKNYFEWRVAGKWNNDLAWLIQLGWSLHPPVLADNSTHNLCVYIRPFISLKPEAIVK